MKSEEENENFGDQTTLGEYECRISHNSYKNFKDTKVREIGKECMNLRLEKRKIKKTIQQMQRRR